MPGRAYYKFQNVNSFPNLEDFLAPGTAPATDIPKRVTLDIKTQVPNAVQDDPKKEQQRQTVLSLILGKVVWLSILAASSLLVIGGWISLKKHVQSGTGILYKHYLQ